MGAIMALDRPFWNGYAVPYPDIWDEVQPNRELHYEAIRRAMIDDHLSVLDVCCGDGAFLKALQERGYGCRVTGLDFSPVMLERARQLPYYALHEVDLNLPLSEWPVTGPYDRLVFTNGLYVFPDPPDLLRKLSQLAAPGALMVVSLPVPNPDQNAILNACLGDYTGEARKVEAGRLLKKLDPIMPFNRQIALEGNFPTERQLSDWFEDTDWDFIDLTRAYAEQNWLAVVRRR
jgi:SAM-dependent methyltransferase